MLKFKFWQVRLRRYPKKLREEIKDCRLRVCVIALEDRGGMVHYAGQLVNALSRTINHVHVVVPEKVAHKYFGPGVSVSLVPWPERRHSSLKSVRVDRLLRCVLKMKPDVIHITAVHPWLVPFILILTKKYPIVATIHDVEKHPGDRDPYTFLWFLSRKVMKKSCDKLFVHGNKLRDQLISQGISKDKIVVIPLGAFQFFSEYKRNHVKEQNAVLFFGRIRKYKGVEYLIRAEPSITKEIPDAKIIIAGMGDLSKYRSLIENNEKFEIINRFIPDEQVAELFQRSKIVVLPYIEASQTAIAGIAYAFGKPVVATNVGSISEMVDDGKTGVIIPPRNSKALADAVVKILKDDELRKRLGKSGLDKMRVSLSWDKIAEKTVQVYKEVVKEHSRDL